MFSWRWLLNLEFVYFYFFFFLLSWSDKWQGQGLSFFPLTEQENNYIKNVTSSLPSRRAVMMRTWVICFSTSLYWCMVNIWCFWCPSAQKSLILAVQHLMRKGGMECVREGCQISYWVLSSSWEVYLGAWLFSRIKQMFMPRNFNSEFRLK